MMKKPQISNVASWGGGPKVVVACVLFMVGYVAILQDIYVKLISPVYGYLGFGYKSPDKSNYELIIAFACLLACLMPRRFDKPSVAVLWVHFLAATVPTMLVTQFTPILEEGDGFRFALMVGASWILVLFLSSQEVRPKVLSAAVGVSPKAWAQALSGLGIFAILFLLSSFGLHLHLAGLSDIRDVRFGYRAALSGAVPGTSYLVLAAGNVLNPTLMAYGWLKRHMTMAIIGLVGQLTIYSLAGYKTVILSIPAVIALLLWLRHSSQPKGSTFLRATVGIMGTAWGAFTFFGSTTLAIIFVMRLIVAPGNIAAGFVSIFQDREQLYWSQSFMSWAIHYPFQLSPNFLVGSLLRDSAVTSANVNLYGDGFISMRFTGILIESLVLVMLLWALDIAARGLPVALSAAIVLVPSYGLANSNIFTALLGGGFLATTLMLASVPRERRRSDQRTVPEAARRSRMKEGVHGTRPH